MKSDILAFTTGTFQRLFTFAAENNLRLVAINLRHYPGSTPLSSAELAALKSDAGSQASFTRDRGLEIAAFLEWFIRKENIPKKTPSLDRIDGDQIAGGLSLLGWSSGNCITLSFLAHADVLSKESQDSLNTYLRAFVIYGVYLQILFRSRLVTPVSIRPMLACVRCYSPFT